MEEYVKRKERYRNMQRKTLQQNEWKKRKRKKGNASELPLKLF